MLENDISKRIMSTEFKKILGRLTLYLQEMLGMNSLPKLKFMYDKQNSEDIFGKTGDYEISTNTIQIYVIGRHPKDILKTYCHEMIHKSQHDNNLFNINNEHDTLPGYAQRNSNMRNAERDAYSRGDILFRDFEDYMKIK